MAQPLTPPTMSDKIPTFQPPEKETKLTEAETLNQDRSNLTREGEDMIQFSEAAQVIAKQYEIRETKGALREKDRAMYEILKKLIGETKAKIEEMRQEYMGKFQSLKSINPNSSFRRPPSLDDMNHIMNEE